MLPGPTRVDGFINPIPMRGLHAAYRTFTGADKNDVRITFRDIDSTYANGIEKAVGDILPGSTRACGFPDTASRRPEIVGKGIIFDAGDCGNPTPAE